MTEIIHAGESIRAVLFDFNGTLSNDEPLVFEAYRSTCTSHLGWTLDRRFYDEYLVGRCDDEMLDVIIATAGEGAFSRLELLEERHRQYVRQILRRSSISVATTELVRRLRKLDILLGVVSGAERRDINFVLDRAHLQDAFDVVISQEDVVRHKPDPEGYRLAMRMLGVAAHQTVAFEDSLVGIQAAKAAGALCVAVEGTHARDVLVQAANLVVPVMGPEVWSLIVRRVSDSQR